LILVFDDSKHEAKEESGGKVKRLRRQTNANAQFNSEVSPGMHLARALQAVGESRVYQWET